MNRSTATTAGAPHDTALRGTDLRHIRLLVVDDDPQALPLVEMALTDATFERVIEVTATVAEALERIKSDEHDLYLVDHRLPDGTGIS